MPSPRDGLRSEAIRVGLFGVSRTRSLVALVLAGAFLLGSFLFGTLAETQGWMEVLDGRLFLLVLFVLVVGSTIAAANAYWNDGLVLSWLLVFGPVLGWLWNVFVQGPVFFDVAIVPIAWAVFTALVVGTLGYVIGRRRRDTLGPSEGQGDWPLSVIVGRDYSQRGKWLLLVGALFVLAVGVTYATGPVLELPVDGVLLSHVFYPTAPLSHNTLFGTIVVLGWIGLATWPAYRGAGLLVSWGVLFGPMFGANLAQDLLWGAGNAYPLLNATFTFLAALIFALVLGTGGYLLGTGLRRVIGSPAARRPADDVKT